MAVAGALTDGADVGVAAAVVKDLGTRFGKTWSSTPLTMRRPGATRHHR